MNPETKQALQRRTKELDSNIERLKKLLSEAEIRFDNAKNSRDDLEKQIKELKNKKKKIKEDIG